MQRHAPLSLAAVLSVGLASFASPAQAQDCTPPRILLVVDASASMLGAIGNTTKWQEANDAVNAVLSTFPGAAQYGLMLFPGAAGQCSTGQIVTDVGMSNETLISMSLANHTIAANAQTPAGQTLVTAAQYNLITDPSYDNYVIFVTDGYQYCSVGGGTACATAADASLMNEATPACLPDANDGCYCIQHWPVLGAQALANQGVKTFVVGFGDQVNFQALNQTAVAGGTAPANCDPMANTPSCYYQASMPGDLTSTLGTIVQQVVTDACVGDCGIMGERTCTPNGWSDCDAPSSVSCNSTCNTPGMQQCVNGALTECSSEMDCGGGGSAGVGGAGSGAGGSGSGNGSGAGGSTSSSPNGDQEDPEDVGGCACRSAGSSGGAPWGALALMALGAAAVTRRRRRSR